MAAQEQIARVRAELPEAPTPAINRPALPAEPLHWSDSDADDSLPLMRTPERLLHDEWRIVTSPARTSKKDLRWLVPLAAASAAAIATDAYTMRHVVSSNASFNGANATTSDVLRNIFIGAPVVLFATGELTGQRGPRNTGLLAGEAMVNAYATDAAIKYIMLRERPEAGDRQGHFFSGDATSDPSFVSGHSIVAWSSAAVLAGQYSKPWEQVGIYGAASAVSLTRVLGQQHFPSDVLLGSAAGWLIGHYVFRAHAPRADRRVAERDRATTKQVVPASE